MTTAPVLSAPAYIPLPLLPPLYLDVLRTTGSLLLEDCAPDTLCQRVFEAVREPLGVDVYFHFLVTPDGERLELASSGGNARLRTMLGMPLEFGQAVCGCVAKECAFMNVANVLERDDTMTEIIRSVGTRAYCCHPLLVRGKLLGTLSFGSLTRDEFSHEEAGLFGLIAQQVALATDRRESNRKLHEMELLAAAGRMSAMLAHEINNPLDSLGTALYLMRDAITEDSLRILLDTAESQVQRLAEVTRRTLETCRGRRAEPSLLDVSTMARELAAEIQLPRDVRLETEIEDGLRVRVVAGELRQVMFNLLLNAAQFSPLGGVVRLRVQRVLHRVEIRVSDDGPGISEEARPHIFAPFYSTRPSGGTGIGLWLSQEMVERGGGRLTFVSDPAIRPGTEFIASLPIARV